MTTTPEQSIQDAKEARAQLLALLQAIQGAAATIARYQRAGDDWKDFRTSLPGLPCSAEDWYETEYPIHPSDAPALATTLRSATTQAYTIAGHYRRHAARLEAAVHALWPSVDLHWGTVVLVLQLEAQDRLGYLAPSDEWTDGQEPLAEPLQQAADWLREQDLLPEFGGTR